MMPTDDEIRRVLAEKLMGMKPIEGFYYYGDDTWNPLSNIEQAFQCLEAMVNKGFCPSLVYDDDGKWGVSFSGTCQVGHDHEWQNVIFDDDSIWCEEPAEAIARACYAAVKEG